MDILIKKSGNTGISDIKDINGDPIVWNRAITVKEAASKVERGAKFDCIVLEGLKETELDSVRALIGGGSTVVIVGDLKCDGALNVTTADEFIALASNDFVVENKNETANSGEERIEDSEDDGFSGIIDATWNNGADIGGFDEGLSGSSSGGAGGLAGGSGVAASASASQEAALMLEHLKEASSQRDYWKGVAENLRVDFNALREKMESIMIDESVEEVIRRSSDGSMASSEELNEANREIERLKRELEKLGEERNKNKQLENENKELRNKVTRQDLILTDEQENAEALRNCIAQLSIYGNSLMTKIDMLEEDIKSRKKDSAADAQSLSDVQSLLEKRTKELEDARETINKYLDTLDDYKERVEEVGGDLALAEKDKQNLRLEISELKKQLQDEKDKNNMALNTMQDKEQELAGLRAYNIDKMLNDIAKAKESEQQFNASLNAAMIERDGLKKEVRLLRQQINGYKAESDALKIKLSAHEAIEEGETGKAIDIEYLSKGMIISVIGSGGHGTTSIATALADLLAGSGRRVAIVDLDMRAAKMEECYMKSPFLNTLNSEIHQEDMRTSMGAFIKFGGNTWAARSEDFGIEIMSDKKGGRLVYHSGLYAALKATELAGANYGAIINELGVNYDYVILDLGRVEGYGAIANAQGGIARASNMTVVVSGYNLADIRSTATRLNSSHIEIHRINWVLNMANGKRIPHDMEKIVGNARMRVVVPFENAKFMASDRSLAEFRGASSELKTLLTSI